MKFTQLSEAMTRPHRRVPEQDIKAKDIPDNTEETWEPPKTAAEIETKDTSTTLTTKCIEAIVDVLDSEEALDQIQELGLKRFIENFIFKTFIPVLTDKKDKMFFIINQDQFIEDVLTGITIKYGQSEED